MKKREREEGNVIRRERKGRREENDNEKEKRGREEGKVIRRERK